MTDPAGPSRQHAPYVPPPPYARPADGGAPWPGPPGFAPPPYSPPNGGPAPAAAPVLEFGVVGAGLAGFGALLVVLAQLVLPWYSLDGGLRSDGVRERLGSLGSLANDVS